MVWLFINEYFFSIFMFLVHILFLTDPLVFQVFSFLIAFPQPLNLNLLHCFELLFSVFDQKIKFQFLNSPFTFIFCPFILSTDFVIVSLCSFHFLRFSQHLLLFSPFILIDLKIFLIYP